MVSSGDTQSRHEIVEYGEEECLPSEEAVNMAPMRPMTGVTVRMVTLNQFELVTEVLPRKRWQGLLGLERVLDIVVGNVEVGRQFLS